MLLIGASPKSIFEIGKHIVSVVGRLVVVVIEFVILLRFVTELLEMYHQARLEIVQDLHQG